MRRLLLGLAAVIGLIVLLPSVVSAHVHVDGDDVEPGGYGTLTFRVPNERDDASTVKIDVQLPKDTPFGYVGVEPVPGWKIEVKKEKLAKPIETDDGEMTEAASEIVWSGGEIKPGEFQEFKVSVGPIPDVESIAFPTIQTYSDGQEASWIEKTPAGGEEPEHPAPVLAVGAEAHGDSEGTATTEAAGSTNKVTSVSVGASQDDVDSANTKALVGTILGLLGLVLGSVAIVLAVRNKRTTS